MSWSLSKLLSGLHDDIERRLQTVRASIEHPGTKGDASEEIWLELLQEYLPKRYEAAKAFVVDCDGQFSEQIDVVVFDRQYSPFIFKIKGATFIPAESVYAVFESKQAMDAGMVSYAQNKIASVRKLRRTSLPIPHAGGTYPAKPPIRILGGLLAFESTWKPAMGNSFLEALKADTADGQIDLGCVAAHGHYVRNRVSGDYEIHEGRRAATAFLFSLISELQFSGTVPMIDVLAYGKWLTQ